MVTPEMLLFLAERMGLPNPCIINGGRESPIAWTAGSEFNPATDDAQFGRLVVWALQEDIKLERVGCEIVALHYSEYRVDHDSTPDSIRAAAVVAVCRALGWEGT